MLGLVRGKRLRSLPKTTSKQIATNNKAAAALETVVTKCGDVAELTNQSVLDSRQKERKHLIDVIRCLKFLARQGIAIQGNPGEDNFTQLLKQFCPFTRNSPIKFH